MANAIAVFPVPGGPAMSSARPDIFFDLIRSSTIPAAYQYRNYLYYKFSANTTKPQTHLARCLLAHQTAAHLERNTILVQSQTLDVTVRGDALCPDGAFNLFDLHCVWNKCYIYGARMVANSNLKWNTPMHCLEVVWKILAGCLGNANTAVSVLLSRG